MKEYRRVPLAQLRRRLQVEEYERETPFEAVEWRPAAVRIRMKQHAGEPAVPVVEEGRKVKKGRWWGAWRRVNWARTCMRASTARCAR